MSVAPIFKVEGYLTGEPRCFGPSHLRPQAPPTPTPEPVEAKVAAAVQESKGEKVIAGEPVRKLEMISFNMLDEMPSRKLVIEADMNALWGKTIQKIGVALKIGRELLPTEIEILGAVGDLTLCDPKLRTQEVLSPGSCLDLRVLSYTDGPITKSEDIPEELQASFIRTTWLKVNSLLFLGTKPKGEDIEKVKGALEWHKTRLSGLLPLYHDAHTTASRIRTISPEVSETIRKTGFQKDCIMRAIAHTNKLLIFVERM